MMSPVQAPTASSKLLVEPARRPVLSNRTSNGALRMNSRTMSVVLSVELSSLTTTSSGGRSCPAMLASCSCRYVSPLYVHSATEMVREGERRVSGGISIHAM